MLLLNGSLDAADKYGPVWSSRYRPSNAEFGSSQPGAAPVIPFTGPLPVFTDTELSGKEQTALREDLPIEHQQYLLYLYARTGNAPMAESLARRVLARDPGDRDALLAMTAMYADKQQADQSLAYASSLYRLYPNDREAAYYYGMANYFSGNYPEATGILQQLRIKEFERKPFPYNVDLAQSALKAGNWQQAIAAYRDILDNNHIDDELRHEVRTVLDQLYRRHLSLVDTRANGYILDSGSFWQYQVEGRHQFGRRTRVFGHAEYDRIKVEQVGVLRRRTSDAIEAWAGIEYELKPHLFLSGWAGGAQAGAQGGAKILHRFRDKGDVSLEFFGNQKSRDSLLLQSLDGRHHRLTLAGSYYVTPRLLTFGQLGGRKMSIDGSEIGNAISASWNAEFFLLRAGPVFRVGYRGVAGSFGRRTDDTTLLSPAVIPGTAAALQSPLLQQFVLNRVHRHGIYADWVNRLFGPTFLHLRGGVDYAFDQSSFEFNSRIGLRYYPRRSLELSTELGYTSAATTADGASGQLEINIAIKYWF